jgi:xanthine/CO dehydrogenase XdhC/CoxF family maturation factor
VIDRGDVFAANRFPVWSRDGKTLAYCAGGAARIFEVPVDASSAPRRIANLTGVPSDWSEDGHLLFFRFEDGTVALATYLVANGEFRSVGPGSEAQFSPDGAGCYMAARKALPSTVGLMGSTFRSARTEALNRDGAVTADRTSTLTPAQKT